MAREFGKTGPCVRLQKLQQLPINPVRFGEAAVLFLTGRHPAAPIVDLGPWVMRRFRCTRAAAATRRPAGDFEIANAESNYAEDARSDGRQTRFRRTRLHGGPPENRLIERLSGQPG